MVRSKLKENKNTNLQTAYKNKRSRNTGVITHDTELLLLLLYVSNFFQKYFLFELVTW